MANVDASIYAQFAQKPKTMADFDRDAVELGLLKQQRESGALQQLLQKQQFEEKTRQIQDADALRQLQRSLGGLPETQIAPAFRQAGRFSEAEAFEKNRLANQKIQFEIGSTDAKLQIEKLKSGIDQFNKIAEIAATAVDQPSYDRARETVAQLFGPERVANMPQQFDPAIKAQQEAMAMGVKSRLENELKRLQLAVTTRGQDITASTAQRGQDITMRGQDISSETARRGQDITMRGQDLTDAREREKISAESGKPLTDAQAKAALFGARMQASDDVLKELELLGTTTSVPGARTRFGVGATLNVALSENQQKLNQAKRDFVNAVLRRESGAVISDAEFENAEKQYFPQVGDTVAVIEQKARNRALATRGILVEVPEARRDKVLSEIRGAQGAQEKTVTFEGRQVKAMRSPRDGKYYVKKGNEYYLVQD